MRARGGPSPSLDCGCGLETESWGPVTARTKLDTPCVILTGAHDCRDNSMQDQKTRTETKTEKKHNKKLHINQPRTHQFYLLSEGVEWKWKMSGRKKKRRREEEKKKRDGAHSSLSHLLVGELDLRNAHRLFFNSDCVCKTNKLHNGH